ncbi:unnamed protein product [Brassica napus]|uniref:(rape) hypothetical protein n=1 Tax=Brassica napus TaxID=3708 RepID=A0A816VYT8_BRANA|nr:unnamed protein product [Brassica napus]
MTKNLNPNSHKRLIGDTSKSWSDLPLDLLNLADFQRAKSVCSSWLSTKDSTTDYSTSNLCCY